VALLGNLTGSSHFFNTVNPFYNDVATQSLRFDGSNSKLTRTPSSSGNQKKWTTSFWVKRTELGVAHYLWSGGSYSGNDGIAAIYFESDDKIHTYYDTSGSNPYGNVNSRVYRDTSAWYHIVWAVDAANTVHKIWVNGVEESLSSGSQPPNFDYGMNRAGTNQAFGVAAWGGSPNLDGYLAQITHLDGQYLDETYFGEFKNGVWIAKDTSDLTFGTNGFLLKFDQTGVGTASTSTIGADTSGNTNHFTSSGIVASDCAMPDSPENNFATINPLIKSGNTFSEGNLKVTTTTTTPAKFVSTIGVTSGKWFMEFRHSGDGNYPFGITSDTQQRDYLGMSDGSTSVSVWGTSSNSNAFVNNSQVSWDGSGTTWSAGDIIGLALNADDSILTVYKNGSSIGSYDYSGLNWSEHFFAGGNYVAGTYSPNFGQDSTFQGAISAGGNSDGKGIGDFKYAPPSGYLALCSANLPEPTIGSNSLTQADDHFNTVLYTGNGSSSSATQDISGVGFKPDWLWIKRRSSSASHNLRDSTRGVLKHLQSDGTGAEDTESDAGVTAFLDDGFRLKGTNAGTGQVNASGGTFVAWNWKANGGTTTTNDASATGVGHIDSVYQANTDAGFSIVTWTGIADDTNNTIAHGLGVTPAMHITKSRSTNSAGHWMVWHQEFADTRDNLFLNLTNATNAQGFGGSTPTNNSTVFETSATTYTNVSGDDYVSYVFAEIEGYSKFGSYTGNGSTDGTFVYTGFRPAWIMVKRTDSANNWVINDSTRATFNEITGSSSTSYADTNNQESDLSTNVDFLSNGFKARTTGGHRNASGLYIYMAFAEAPFKYANAR
jgi:hypothetical protein